jgi:hypothetical protein
MNVNIFSVTARIRSAAELTLCVTALWPATSVCGFPLSGSAVGTEQQTGCAWSMACCVAVSRLFSAWSSSLSAVGSGFRSGVFLPIWLRHCVLHDFGLTWLVSEPDTSNSRHRVQDPVEPCRGCAQETAAMLVLRDALLQQVDRIVFNDELLHLFPVLRVVPRFLGEHDRALNRFSST